MRASLFVEVFEKGQLTIVIKVIGEQNCFYLFSYVTFRIDFKVRLGE